MSDSVAENAPDAGGLFSFRGRMGRGAYWGVIVANLVFGLLTGVWVATGGGIGGTEGIVTSAILVAVIAWLLAATYAKRSHDLGMSGWIAIGGFIPLLNFLIIPCLGILPGTAGPNRFGADPQTRLHRERSRSLGQGSDWSP